MRFALSSSSRLFRSGVLQCTIAGLILAGPGPGTSLNTTQAADKPLWKEKGKPTGEIKGGTDGSPFKDRAWGRLAEISVRGGSWLDSVRCTYEDGKELVKGDIHGGTGGDETVIKLGPGEHLIQVSGVLLKQDDSTVIGSLSFKTTKRTVGPVGKTLEGAKFTLDAPKDQEICGFQGRSGDYLSALGMVCRPRP